jgi:hypothetical protein
MAGENAQDRETQRTQPAPSPDDGAATAHRRTYGAFMRFVGYGLAAVALVLILLGIFLV